MAVMKSLQVRQSLHKILGTVCKLDYIIQDSIRTFGDSLEASPHI